jgi:multidrug resistance efflux pump
MKHRLIPLLVLLAAGAAFYVFRADTVPWARQAARSVSSQYDALIHRNAQETGLLQASGALEARTLDVSSTKGGRLAAVHVLEGDRVTAGAPVATLDAAILDARIREARAALAVAEAQIAALEAGAHPADIAVAQAAVEQARAARDAAEIAWQDALALVEAPSDLDVTIAEAQAALDLAEQKLAAAQANATTADLQQAEWGRIVKLLEEGIDVFIDFPGAPSRVPAPADKLNNARLQWNLSSQRTWEAHAAAQTAVAARDAARQKLLDLRSQRANPLQLKAQADTAGAAFYNAESAVELADATVAVLKAGATDEQLASVRSLAERARRAIAALEIERSRLAVNAPADGTVTSLLLHEGEVAAPGAPIAHLADLEDITLTVYVPEPDLDQARLGDAVQVYVDAFPDRLFTGKVIQVADQAEFTPKNVQTSEERANTVYAVKIALPNAAGQLKPGMPADARFTPTGQVPPATGESSPAADDTATLEASGTIEAEIVSISGEIAGRIAETLRVEGDSVAPGERLVLLDTTEIEAQLHEAEALVSAAESEVAEVRAAAQPESVAQAEAGVHQAEVALDNARLAVENAEALRESPQALDTRIHAAQAQLAVNAAALDLARARLKEAHVQQDSLPNPGTAEDKARRAIYDQQVIAAQADLRAAEAQDSGTRQVLAQLRAIRANPVALDAAVHAAESAVARAEAALNSARTELARVKAPAQPERIALVEAKVAQARAAADILRATVAKGEVRSPVAGVISTQSAFTGEVVQPGQPIYSVSDPSRLTLRIYVPAGRMRDVRLGQTAAVRVDAYPEAVFRGAVSRIADQAEYTPRNVQTQEQRVKTVFAVEIALENPDGLLRAGMPADAVLAP